MHHIHLFLRGRGGALNAAREAAGSTRQKELRSRSQNSRANSRSAYLLQHAAAAHQSQASPQQLQCKVRGVSRISASEIRCDVSAQK